MKKVGQVKADGSVSGKGWNDYRKTSSTPTGWKDILVYEKACNADTVGFAVVKYTPKIRKGFYGWMDSSFVTEYAGSTYDVYQCSAD